MKRTCHKAIQAQSKAVYTFGKVVYVSRKDRDKADGFSIIELATVVAILSIIAAISIPNIVSLVRLAQIDQAKSLLNLSIAECLSQLRSGISPSETSPSGGTISDELLDETGYKINPSKNRCSNFSIVPTDESDVFLYEMGFQLDPNGSLRKLAVPAKDQSSLASCKAWAGKNCGVTPEQQAEWDRLAAIEKAKKECNDNFYEWLRNTPPNGGSGSRNRWDDATNTCSLNTWAFEGTIQKDEAAFKAAREAKLGKICSQKLKDQESKSPPFDGRFTDTECGIDTWFCSGKDLNTSDKTAWDACKENERQVRCTAAEGNWKSGSTNGKFSEPGCEAKWKCGTSIYTNEADYLGDEACKPKEPPKPTCIEPPKAWYCPFRPTRPECAIQCK